MSSNSATAYAALAFAVFIGYKLLSKKRKFTHSVKYEPETKDHYGAYDNADDSKKKKKYFASNPWESIDIQFAKKGTASFRENPPVTVFDVFEKGVELDPNDVFMAKEYPNPKNDNKLEWKNWTRKQVYTEVQAAARGFIELGIKEWESVCIMGFNSPQWVFADLAAMYAGGLACGLYTTNGEGECKYIVNHCKGSIVVLQNKKLLNKFINIQNDLKYTKAVILYEDDDAVKEYNDNININKSSIKVISWNELINNYGEMNKDKNDKIIAERKSKIKPSNCCTLIYTSGTTGRPKGVMLSHDNITFNIKSVLESQRNIKFWGDGALKQKIVSYLPLSHIAAQCLDIHGPIAISANGGKGAVYFARQDALKGSLTVTLQHVQPTVFLGVPRVWEKIEEKMRLIGKNGNFVVKNISLLAKKIGLIASYNRQIDGNMEIPFGFNIINKLLFNTIRKKLGFTNLKLAITGAAPIRQQTVEYFHSLNIPLIEAYGMSETTALCTMGVEYHNHITSVGPALKGCQVNIDKTNSEIITRGRNIMMGYIYDLDKTKETIDAETGYLHTGDIGKLNNNSNLIYITGRIKELIITAGGENIAPVPIENYIKTIRSGISNFVLIGENKKYLTALVTLKCKQSKDVDDAFTNYLDHGAREIDPKCKTVDDAKKSNEWKIYIESGIKDYNNNDEKCVSRAQKIQYFKILDNDFSIHTNELTSTLKLKRTVIRTKYKEEIESMYQKKK